MLKILFMSVLLNFCITSSKSLMVSCMVITFFFFFLYNPNIYGLISMNLGCDSISGHLILLSFVIIFLMILSSNKVWMNMENKTFYWGMLVMLLNMLILIFVSMNMVYFFMWFELILIPMFVLIMGWGVQSERFNAGLYFMFYTVFGSLPLMLGMIYLYKENSVMFIMMMNEKMMSMGIWWVLFYGAFLIKLPMYFFHYWLPKAHVEAPVAGSMMLAGVLLKLGGYGIYRMRMVVGKLNIDNYLISICLLGGIFTSMMCLRQFDVKSLVAYSSIGHMGLMLSGILAGGVLGYSGGMYMMIGHGLCSSGMFCIMNIIYERVGSRSLLMMKGILMMNPSLMLWLFLIMSSNMSAPPSLNLLSEINLFGNIVVYSIFNMLFLLVMFMLACAYSLYLYSTICHSEGWKNYSIMMMSNREMLIMMMHWAPLNFMFLKMGEFYLM